MASCQATRLSTSACSGRLQHLDSRTTGSVFNLAPRAAVLPLHSRTAAHPSATFPLPLTLIEQSRWNCQQVCKWMSSSSSGYLGSASRTASWMQSRHAHASPKRPSPVSMRLKGEHSFTVKGDLEKVFDYASDFSHINAWDPGTPDARKDSSLTRPEQAPVGVGTQFNLKTVLLGYVTPTVYEIMEYQPPRFVKLYGVSDFHDSWDSIWFQRDEQDPSLIRIKYISEIQLTGWYRYCEFFMSWLLLNLFKDAVKGLERKMKSIEQDFQPMANVR